MNIIIEGIDRSGKSTVCDYLVKTGFQYYHFDYPKQLDVVDIYNKYFENSNEMKTRIVFDRAMYSEWAYSRYYNRPSNMTIENIHYLENKFLMHSYDQKVCVLYIENEISKNLELLNEEGEGKITSMDQIIQLRKYYYDVLKQSTLPVFTYNYNFQNITDVLKCINSFFNIES